VLDGWKSEVKIQIDSISRLRSGTWNYDENVRDGFLVFEGVDHISFDPPGRIPNDEIGSVEFLGHDGDRFTVVVDIGSGYELGNYVDVKVTIRAKAVAIEKPGEGGARIRE
jgi:hypothetical protein